MKNYVIYTDGAYSSSRDQGGIGIVFTEDNKEIMHFNKMYKHTTNNQMELRAVILALKSIKIERASITIMTDSQYVIGCATMGWKREKNTKLWKIFDKIFKDISEKSESVTFKWVKGHENNQFNNLADTLAVQASQEIEI